MNAISADTANTNIKGSKDGDAPSFKWIPFYKAIANNLLDFRNRRDVLIAGIHNIASQVDCINYLQDQFKDGSSGPLKDICPFTVIGMFNRGITDANRKDIASKLATLLGVSEAVPDTFEGLPKLHNQNSWFFGFERIRESEDIDKLWQVFDQAIAFVNDKESESEFISAYNEAIECYGVGWKLTIGLYWISPENYPTLDKQSQAYLSKHLNIKFGMNVPDGHNYLEIRQVLKEHFQKDTFPVHSFPELSLAAFKDGETSAHKNKKDSNKHKNTTDAISENKTTEGYTIEKILADGCFIKKEDLEKILDRFQTKKNLILQGPPGTGKTWLAKRLAYALIGESDNSKVRVVQFHPNLSYEDFIRGWRPTGDGKLTLVDGPFMEMIKIAKDNKQSKYVIVIEEINRGNPAQIFGEMLTLLEADKRTDNEALELSYKRSDKERVFIPDNLYVIGTMNIADRSIALLDLALRRRFAFIDLKSAFGKRPDEHLGKRWQEWVGSKFGIDIKILEKIKNKLNELNEEISNDNSLGPQFQIGHSYVTPSSGSVISDAEKWFCQVVNTEIGPLLDEYWFDDLKKSRKIKAQLKEGFYCDIIALKH